MKRLIYNVTVSVDKSHTAEWLVWMQEVHVPKVMETGHFLEAKISEVLMDSEDSISYAVQYLCACRDDYDQYMAEHALRLQAEHTEKFGTKAVSFRTLLDVHKSFEK